MIASEFLHELAVFTDNKIAKVVLNNSHEITSFTLKQVDDNIVALTYMIPGDLLNSVELVELRDNTEQIISSHAVYIPITTDTIVNQTLTVKEG